jgi:uncharacterized membrane protein
MERMLVAIFDNETKAYEGLRALNELDREGSISIHAESVIQKNADGNVSQKQAEGDYPIRTLGGTALGSLIGVLGGPAGVAVGATAGAMAGLFGDAYVAGVNSDFLADVAERLTPGKVAVLADVNEEWVTPVNSKMEALGGVVFRTAWERVEQDQWAREIAALDADIAQLQAEQAQATGELKAKIQSRIDDLNQKRNEKIGQAKQRTEHFKKETNSKIEALRQKAAKVHRDNKAAIEARIQEIREKDEQAEARLRSAIAGGFRKAADRLEKAG